MKIEQGRGCRGCNNIRLFKEVSRETKSEQGKTQKPPVGQ